jgi:hypothetical protein
METRGRKPGTPKTGGAVKGSIKTHTHAVREAVLRVFEEVNRDDTYLRQLAVDDQKLFLSLLARLIPQAHEVEIDQRVTIDLGSAMADADQRVAAMRDVTPVDPPTVRIPTNQQEAQKIYGKPGEQPVPDPAHSPGIYDVEAQPGNEALWEGYDDPQPAQRQTRQRRNRRSA